MKAAASAAAFSYPHKAVDFSLITAGQNPVILTPFTSRASGLTRVSVILAFAAALPSGANAQTPEISTGSTLSASLLGVSSGAVLGTLGAIVPCTLTRAGPRCVARIAGMTSLTWATSGLMLGSASPARTGAAWRSAGIGAAAGTVVGLALMPLAQEWTLREALTLGVIGGAIGSAPRGAAIGFGAGAAVGAVTRLVQPRIGLGEVAGVALTGMAVGGMTEWILNARGAMREAPGPQLTIVIPVAF